MCRFEPSLTAGVVTNAILTHYHYTPRTSYREVKALTNQDSDFTGADLLGSNSADLKIGTFTQELRLTSTFDGPLNFLLGGFYFNEKINQTGGITFGTQFRDYANFQIVSGSGGALNVATLETHFGALEGNAGKYTGTFFATGRA